MRAESYLIYFVGAYLGCSSESETRSAPPSVSPPSVARPDLMLITVESWRADRLPFENHHRNTMPEMSTRMTEALVFTHGISPSSWTLPSMASIMTGLMPSEHGLRLPGLALESDRETTAERLTNLGYESAFFGVNPWLVDGSGLHRGFDGAWDPRPGDSGDHLLRDVGAWLEERDSTAPLFLHLHFFEPHCQYTAPRQMRGMFDALEENSSAGPVLTQRQYESMGDCYRLRRADGSPELDLDIYHRRYDEEVLTTDALLERSLSLMDEASGLEEMLVIVTGDHGEAFWEHGDFGHGRQLYEESVVVPLLLFGGLAGDAGVLDHPVSLVDVHHTLLAAAGVESDELRDLRRSTESTPVFSETEQDGVHLRAAWIGTRKVIWDWERDTWQGFDLANDPGEEEPMYADLLLKRALRTRFGGVEAIRSAPEEPGSPGSTQDEALRSLGYR